MKIANIYRRIAGFSVRRPYLVLVGVLILSVLAVVAAVNDLTLKTSNLDLIDPSLEPVRNFEAFAKEFGTPNVLVVVLEGADRHRLGQAVDLLIPRIESGPGVKNVIGRLPLEKEKIKMLGVDEYLSSRDGGMFMIFVQPEDPHSSAETIGPFVDGVRSAVKSAGLGELGVTAGLTGIPQYAIDDRDTIQQDISRLSLISLALILGLFVTAFGAFRRPLMAVVSLLFGVLLTAGVIVIYPGHLTLLSAFFASIMFGLGIDYGIHVINRVGEYCAEGDPEKEAVPRAIGSLARELTAGALTTAFVFFAMMFSGFRGFEELGFVAGVGILICLAMTITVLPALMVAVPYRKTKDKRSSDRKIGRTLIALQKTPLVVVLGVGALLLAFLGRPVFDSDYLNLQPEGSESVRLERAMVERSDYSPQFAVFTADSKSEAADLVDQLLDDESVADVRSIVDLEMMSGGRVQLPASFLAGFKSANDRYAVYAYPARNVWDPKEQADFAARMQALDPEVTGMPILGRFMVERSKRALKITSIVGSTVLLICVFLDLRNVKLTVLAVLPTFLTLGSMGAIMKFCGLAFNPLNVMALPVVIGIAVDDGIHIVHRFLAEKGDVKRTLAGSGRSVVLTSATTIAAFGVLSFTSHRGLASFAMALTIGVAVALLLSVIVLPYLLSRFVKGCDHGSHT